MIYTTPPPPTFTPPPRPLPTSPPPPFFSGRAPPVKLDPSRGVILEQLTHQPTLLERFQIAGIVGKVIAGLLVIGLLIAVLRGTVLLKVRHQIKKQLKTPDSPGNNPLGRVLSVYNKDKDRTVEALELRLLEAVVDAGTYTTLTLPMNRVGGGADGAVYIDINKLVPICV